MTPDSSVFTWEGSVLEMHMPFYLCCAAINHLVKTPKLGMVKAPKNGIFFHFLLLNLYFFPIVFWENTLRISSLDLIL